MNLNRIKILVDVIITVTLVLLYNTHGALGLAFHEWAGILILVGFVVHVLLSWNWVVAVSKRLFGKTTARSRFSYVLDVVLLIAMLWSILSGVFISRIAVPFLAWGEPIWRATHVPVSYLTLIIVGVHLGMNWGWVMTTVRRLTRTQPLKPVGVWVLRAVAVAVFAAGVYSVVATNTFSHVVAINGTGGERGMRGGDRPAGAAPTGEGRGRPSGTNAPETGHQPGRGQRGGGGGVEGGRSASDLSAALLHTGVIAAFVGPTYYLDKAITANRRRRRTKPVTVPSAAS